MATSNCSTKICSKCAQEKPIGEFAKNSQSKDGYRPDCRDCKRAVDRLWRKRNLANLAKKKAASYAADPEKHRAWARSLYQKNREKMLVRARSSRERNKEWYIEYRKRNSEQLRQASRECYRKNKVRRHQKQKEWKVLNKESHSAYLRRYTQENKERIYAYQKQWVKENKDKVRATKARRRAKEAGCEGSHTAEEIAKLDSFQKNKCACCKKKLYKNFHIDHVKPISKGGSNDIGNIQLLCPSCNHRKSAKDPIEFMQQNGFLL